MSADARPFHWMVKYPDACSKFIGTILQRIMRDPKAMEAKLQNVEVMGELTKHLIRSWYVLEGKYDLVEKEQGT